MKNTEMLKKNYQFKTILTKGKYYTGEKIEAYIKQNNKQKKELGLAIGVKTGKAYARNRIKRLIRENYNKIENQIKPGNSIIILIKKNQEIKNITYNDIKKDLEKIIQKAKIKQ